jgi:hypothetical protein
VAFDPKSHFYTARRVTDLVVGGRLAGMPDPLIVLDPSQVKKSGREILSERGLSDSELGNLEPGAPYWGARFKRARQLSRGRIVWSVCGLLAAVVGSIYTGATWKNALPGLAVGVGTLLVAWLMYFLFNYLFIAPLKMDAAAKQQIQEERRKGERAVGLVLDNYEKCFGALQGQKHPLLNFEVDTTPSGSQVYLNRDNEEDLDAIPIYNLRAHLLIRYRNDDKEARGVKGILLSIVSASGQERQLKEIEAPTLRHPKESNASVFAGLKVQGSDTTEYYVQGYLVEVPRECAESLGDDSFLRITMDAMRQEPSFKDFEVNWTRARKDSVPITLRGA